MTAIDQDRTEAFRKYIEGKTVAFVGACPNLIGKGLGKRIDKYDIVIRSNHFWKPLDLKFIPDYGQRCDVCYINRQYFRETKPFPIYEMKGRGLSWLVFKGLHDKRLADYNRTINSRTYQWIVPEVTKTVLSATAGLYLCVDLLKFNPGEFYYTGVDFFASRKPMFEYDNYQEYLPGYLPEKIREQGNIINMGKTQDGHDFLGNAQYFYSLFLRHKNFKTDDFILDLLYGIVHGKIKQGDIKW